MRRKLIFIERLLCNRHCAWHEEFELQWLYKNSNLYEVRDISLYLLLEVKKKDRNGSKLLQQANSSCSKYLKKYFYPYSQGSVI